MGRREKEVTLNDKKFKVKELRVSEFFKIKDDVINDFKKAEKTEDFINGLIEKHLAKFIPEATKEDVENAYISEIESVVEAVKEVNFTGFEKVIGKVTNFFGKEKIESAIKNLFTLLKNYMLTQELTEDLTESELEEKNSEN